MSRFGSLTNNTTNKKQGYQQNQFNKKPTSSRFQNLADPPEIKKHVNDVARNIKTKSIETRSIETNVVKITDELFPELPPSSTLTAPASAHTLDYALIKQPINQKYITSATSKSGWICLNKTNIYNYIKIQKEKKSQNDHEQYNKKCKQIRDNMVVRYEHDRDIREFYGEVLYPIDIHDKYTNISYNDLITSLFKNARQLTRDITQSKYQQSQYELIKLINISEHKMHSISECIDSYDNLYNPNENN